MNDLVYLAWPMMDPTPMVPCFCFWAMASAVVLAGGGDSLLNPEFMGEIVVEKAIYFRNCFFLCVLLLWGVFVIHHCGEIDFHSLSISLVRFFLMNDGHVC